MRALILLLLIVNTVCADPGPGGLLGVRSDTAIAHTTISPQWTTPIRPASDYWKDTFGPMRRLRLRMTWSRDAGKGLFVEVTPGPAGSHPIKSVLYTVRRAYGQPMHGGTPVPVKSERGARVRLPLPAPVGGLFGDAGSTSGLNTNGVHYVITAHVELAAPMHTALSPLLSFIQGPRETIVAVSPALTVMPMHSASE